MAMYQVNDVLFALDQIACIQKLDKKVRVHFAGSPNFQEFDWKPYGKALWEIQTATADHTVMDKVVADNPVP
jgi:hypothetical protein